MNNFVLLALLLPAMAFANEESSSSGTRGGGQTVDVNGRPALRDLVDKSNCEWVTAADFQPGLSYWPKLLQSIDETNWYFARQIQYEANRLTICMTRAPLIQIPADDLAGVTVYFNGQYRRQVAIRWDDRIYLDGTTFDRMSQIDKAYLYLHEVMHSLIPMDVEHRNTKLRSMISTIRQNERMRMSAGRFDLQLAMNSIQTLTGITEESREVVDKLLDPNVSLRERILFVRQDNRGQEGCRVLKSYFRLVADYFLLPCKSNEELKNHVKYALNSAEADVIFKVLRELKYPFDRTEKAALMHHFARANNVEAVKLLFEDGVEPLSPPNGTSPFLEAILSGSDSVLEYFVTVLPAETFKVSHTDDGYRFYSLLQWAVRSNQKASVEFLIRHGYTDGAVTTDTIDSLYYRWSPKLNILGFDRNIGRSAILLALEVDQLGSGVFKLVADLLTKQQLELLLHPSFPPLLRNERNALLSVMSILAGRGEREAVQYLIETKGVTPCKFRYERASELRIITETDPALAAEENGYTTLARYIRQKQEEQKCRK